MKELSYADRHVVTADEIADGVLQYAKALATAHLADTVTMPALGEDGRISTVEMLIGPSSQITSVPVSDSSVVIPVEATITDLANRTRLLRGHHASVAAPVVDEGYDPDFL
ncbi:MAG TPA: hypothetical protein VIL55_12145 [Naasia sp.]|jgi:hypothetical protein